MILLLGSLTSFSVAMQSTGLADALALVLQQGLAGWPSYTALMVVFIGTTLLTQVMSNAASVALWRLSRCNWPHHFSCLPPPC